ncbi:MAG: hypothetical protein N2D54_03730, partial [Chloroflexota bacterium]
IALSSVTALIFMGAAGGTSFGVAPEFNLGLVEGFICPNGTSAKYESIKRSFHLPGESQPQVTCINDLGEEVEEVTLKSLGAVLGIYFLVCFLPMTIGGSVLGIFIFGRMTRQPNPESPMESENVLT